MAIVLGTLFALVASLGFRNALAMPEVRQLVVHVPAYPPASPPVRVVLFSDVHAHWPDTTPARLGRVVEQINALRPDVVVAAGDFIGDDWIGWSYPINRAIAPLSRLRARLGVYAVLGNKDYWAGSDQIRRNLERANVRVLVNEAVAAGPLAIGGLDGRLLHPNAGWTGRRNWTLSALSRTPGIKLLVVHRPDEFHWTPRSLPLVLAGHTHCGQIILPVIGPLETGSDFGRKYLCGIVRSDGSTLVVSAGVGTSHLPLRFGAPPDIWLISIGR